MLETSEKKEGYVTEVKLGFGVGASEVRTWETSNFCPWGVKFCCVAEGKKGLESSWN